jgi:hypothetical protein
VLTFACLRKEDSDFEPLERRVSEGAGR